MNLQFLNVVVFWVIFWVGIWVSRGIPQQMARIKPDVSDIILWHLTFTEKENP